MEPLYPGGIGGYGKLYKFGCKKLGFTVLVPPERNFKVGLQAQVILAQLLLYKTSSQPLHYEFLNECFVYFGKKIVWSWSNSSLLNLFTTWRCLSHWLLLYMFIQLISKGSLLSDCNHPCWPYSFTRSVAIDKENLLQECLERLNFLYIQ